MQFYKATYSFERLPFLEKAEFANVHAGKITGSLIFPTPPTAPAQVIIKANALIAAHLAWMATHGDEEYATLLATSGELSGVLKKNANYVTTEANGNKVKIESAGFVPTKDRGTAETENYYVDGTGTSGEVEVHCKKEDNDMTIVWLCYKGKTPPASTDDYKIFAGSSSATIVWSHGFDVGFYYCFIAGRIKTKNNGVIQFLTPIVKLVE